MKIKVNKRIKGITIAGMAGSVSAVWIAKKRK